MAARRLNPQSQIGPAATSAATRRGVVLGGLVGAGLSAPFAARRPAFAAAADGRSVVPLVPGVGSIFAGLPLQCLGTPQIAVDPTPAGARLIARFGGEFIAALALSENRQALTTPQGAFDCVLRTRRPDATTIVHTLRAFDDALGTHSTISIRGRIDAAGAGRIAIRVNEIEAAEFLTIDSKAQILAAFADVRAALAATSLPFNLLALNTFAGWAPPLDAFPSYLVTIQLFTAAGGLAPVLAPAAHQEAGDSPLGRWLKCLMDCCTDCGGCWDDNGLFGHVGCHRCRGTGVLEGLKQATCYNLCVILCVPDAVVGPLKP
jgi:hypothetical protein